MKILLVDNNTEHKSALLDNLAGHKLEIQKYRPGLAFRWQDKDLVILSGGGGEGQEIADKHNAGKLWYEDEMDFVLTCSKPIIGICMGFEVICSAYGAKVEEMPVTLQGYKKYSVTRPGRRMFGGSQISQYEAHKWRVANPPKGFEILAESQSGIDVIRHSKKPILATQFHPEKSGSLDLKQLLLSAN